MWQDILSALAPNALIAASVQAVLMSVALRFIVKALGKRPAKEWIFWAFSAPALFLIVTVTSAVLGTEKRPKLKGQILAVTAGELKYVPTVSPKESPKDATFTHIVASISNTGVPSIATDYTLTVKFSSGVTKTGEAFTIPTKGAKLPHQSGGGSEMIYREDYLPRKTIQPIPKGGCVQGSLLFLVEGASMQDLRAIGTVYRIEFKDLWGETYVAEIRNTGTRDVIYDWPGMRDSAIEGEVPEIMTPSPSPTPNTVASPP